MNVMSVLKAEISRLAKKEAKREVAPVKKANAGYRGLIAGLRKRIDSLEKELAGVKRSAPKAEKVLASKTEPQGRFWITGKGVRKLRQRLGLTQAVFGKLVSVSVPTVVNWEGVEGKVEIRKKATMARLQDIKGKGKKEVAEMLGAETAAEAPKGRKTRKKSKVVKKAKAAKTPKTPKKAKKAKAPPKAKAPKVPKAAEKVEEKPVEAPEEAKKD